MKKYQENDYLLIKKSNVGYLEFSPEDDVFDTLQGVKNSQEVDETIKFDTFDSSRAASNAVVVAYTNSDSLNPDLALYTDLKVLERELKKYVKDYLAAAGEAVVSINDYAKDSEIEQFIDDLTNSQAGNRLSLQLVEDDYEVVATALVLGGKDE